MVPSPAIDDAALLLVENLKIRQVRGFLRHFLGRPKVICMYMSFRIPWKMRDFFVIIVFEIGCHCVALAGLEPQTMQT